MLKIICVKNFHSVKFSRFRSIREICSMVDSYNVDERLESFLYVFSMLSIGRAKCRWLNIVVDLTFTLVGVDLCTHLFIDNHRVMLFLRVFDFHGWP